MDFELRKQPSGAMAVYHPGVRETMHPGLGPWEEAVSLYLGASRLADLLRTPAPPHVTSKDVVVFDVGLGAAANALAAIACREDVARLGAAARPLTIVSFENDLEALRFALGRAGQLGYPLGHEEKLEAILDEGRWAGNGITWEVRLGDFQAMIPQESRRADAIFFDPFSPRTNPAMWSTATLEHLHHCRRPGTTTRLVTYSSAYATRAALLLAGFFVGEWPPVEGARAGTEAATDFSALYTPLGPAWMARWRKEKAPWPPLTEAREHRHLREALLDHPQWSQFQNGESSLQEPPAPRRPGQGKGRPQRPPRGAVTPRPLRQEGAPGKGERGKGERGKIRRP